MSTLFIPLLLTLSRDPNSSRWHVKAWVLVPELLMSWLYHPLYFYPCSREVRVNDANAKHAPLWPTWDLLPLLKKPFGLH